MELGQGVQSRIYRVRVGGTCRWVGARRVIIFNLWIRVHGLGITGGVYS